MHFENYIWLVTVKSTLHSYFKISRSRRAQAQREHALS